MTDCSLLPNSEEKTVHQPDFDLGQLGFWINRKPLIYPYSLSIIKT